MNRTITALTVCMSLFFTIMVFRTNAQEEKLVEIDTTEGMRVSSPVVDTGQVRCYSDSKEMLNPKSGQQFFGQDAQYEGTTPSYRDNGDGTVTDLNTRLMWSKAVAKKKVSLAEAEIIAQDMLLAGYSDWRVPNIKELYSLIDFRGYTGFSRGGLFGGIPSNAVPFINTDYFDFKYGDINAGERYIDAQWLSKTKYVSTTMGSMETLFGVNFADGRIKGYGYKRSGSGKVRKKFYVRYVRGETYGQNNFRDNYNGTVTDRATGLMWMQNDSGKSMNWESALEYAQDLAQAGYDDWRLPNAKELQSIVNYSRSPETTGSPAIDEIFQTTSISNEAGTRDYPFFWTSTTHLDGPYPGSNAVYIAFGRAIGKMHGRVMDVHGAGAQRSDPKTGNPYVGHGPQGDAVRVYNYVRCVRGGSVTTRTSVPLTAEYQYPDNVKIQGSSDREELSRQGGPSDQKRRRMSGPPLDGRGFVERLDRDDDGRVSRSEFDGPEDRFDYHDLNSDGFLTADEAPKGPPPGRGRPPRP